MKAWNFLSFLGGLLVGAIYLGLYLLILKLQEFDFATLGEQWYTFGWVATFALMLGISAGCRDGFGIFNFVIFVIGGIALQFFGIYSLVIGTKEIEAGFSNLFAYLAISGFMTLYWYFFIGIGKGNFFFSAIIPLVLSLLASWLLTATAENYKTIMGISIGIDAGSLVILILLRIINGSAVDY